MPYEYSGYYILDKMFEAKNVAMKNSSGNTVTKDYIIPKGETWCIKAFGGSASVNQAEIEFLFSSDQGVTWLNPYDGTNDKIRCLNLIKGNFYFEVPVALEFESTKSNKYILRIQIKNLSDTQADEIVGWFNGWYK